MVGRVHFEPDGVTRELQAFTDASRELLNRIARRQGLGTTDVTALYLLSAGPMGVAELSERLGIRTASTTVLVDRLAAAGHLRREPHPTDRRRTLVVLEESARLANEAHWWPAIGLLDEVSRSLGQGEREVVLTFLRRATEAMAEIKAYREDPDDVISAEQMHEEMRAAGRLRS